MALQGNLRDFSATEILQLIGQQRKSGCLTLEWNTERSLVWVNEGRIVSTRLTGMSKDDPLLAFLLRTKRLSDEQHRGLLTIQKESGRDLEDLLLNGRYLDAQELGSFVERQILDDLLRIVRWDNGTYRFDPNAKWTNPPLVLMSIEGAIMEAARRVDEQRRYVTLFRDPYQLLGVRDLPDPDEPLSDEERELFGLIDGQHTVADILEQAPLSEYETYEALQRMVDSRWVVLEGHRDPGAPPPPPSALPRLAARTARTVANELLVAASVLGAIGLLFLGARVLPTGSSTVPAQDVYAAAQMRDVRYALDLYHRERGRYPEHLEDLVEDRWIAPDQAKLPGYSLAYRLESNGQSYWLDLQPTR